MKSTTNFPGRFRGIPMVAALTIVFFIGYALGNQHLVGFAQGGNTAPADVQEEFEPFWQVFSLIRDQYVDDIPIEKLVEGAATGMVDALDDPYSGYMNPEMFDMLNSDLEGEFEGIGVVIRTVEDTGVIEVVGLLNGAPAQGVGILPGDIFTAVDDVDVTQMNQTELATLVRGPEGTDVKITMRREDELVDFDITRARITVPNIETKMLDGDVAYIRMNQFSSNAREELDTAISELDVQNRAGLVFDLRDNPGGLLSSAIDIASAFIPEGPVVIEAFGDGSEQVFDADGTFANLGVPVVVLVNESSASASELVAGALQDTDTAYIIGETTLGKGTVQQWLPLQNDAGLRLTIARWLTPDRRWIHKEGITPDEIVEWTPTMFEDPNDPQLNAALQWLQEEAIVKEAA